MILNNNAIALRVQGDLQGARANYAESLAIRRTLGEKAGVAVTLNNLANVVSDEGRLAEATKMYAEESLAINQEVGDKLGIARAWFNIAEMVRLQGDLPRARTLLESGGGAPARLGGQERRRADAGQHRDGADRAGAASRSETGLPGSGGGSGEYRREARNRPQATPCIARVAP